MQFTSPFLLFVNHYNLILNNTNTIHFLSNKSLKIIWILNTTIHLTLLCLKLLVEHEWLWKLPLSGVSDATCLVSNFRGIGIEIDICASSEGDLDLIQLNQDSMNYGNCKNQILFSQPSSMFYSITMWRSMKRDSQQVAGVLGFWCCRIRDDMQD